MNNKDQIKITKNYKPGIVRIQFLRETPKGVKDIYANLCVSPTFEREVAYEIEMSEEEFAKTFA